MARRRACPSAAGWPLIQLKNERHHPDQRCPRRRSRRSRARELQFPRRLQQKRCHIHPGINPRTCERKSVSSFTPGDYLQLDIPAYDAIHFRDFEIPEPFRSVWEQQHVFDLVARNPESGRRNNYSLACASADRGRTAIQRAHRHAAAGQDCPPGAGSSYVFSLRTRRQSHSHWPVR